MKIKHEITDRAIKLKTLKVSKEVEDIIQFLFDQQPLTQGYQHFIKPSVMKALVVFKDKKFMNEFRQALQHRLIEAYNALKSLESVQELETDIDIDSESDEEIEEKNDPFLMSESKWNHECHRLSILIGNLIALLPFAEPEDGESFILPALNQKTNLWEAVTYQVERIAITSKYLATPYYAYGFVPPKDSHAPAQLALMGTTFPRGSGGLITHTADTIPFTSVGYCLFKWGQARYKQWCLKHGSAKNPVLAFGQSLGAIGVIYLAMHYPLHIKAFAYSPPGTLVSHHSNYLKRCQKYGLDDLPEDKITIIVPHRDAAFLFGFWLPPNANCYRLTLNQNTKSWANWLLAPFAAHMKGFSGHPDVQITPLDLEKELKITPKRVLVNAGHQCLNPILFGFNCLRFGKKTWRLPVYGGKSALCGLKSWTTSESSVCQEGSSTDSSIHNSDPSQDKSQKKSQGKDKGKKKHLETS